MTSRLAQMQARFQQKQIQEREEKLLRLYESQQQRAFEKVSRGSAGSNASLSSSTGGGKVRQMFDERRQKAGVDRSYPLEPLRKARPGAKATVQKKQTVKRAIYNNNVEEHRVEEHRVEEQRVEENDNYDKSHDDLIEMMNSHNLNDTLDNEEMPQIGFDEPDEPVFAGKLANVGGRLPSQEVKSPALGKTFRKETKPIVKRTVKPAASLTSQASRPISSPLSSPVRSSLSNTMQSAKAASAKKTTPPSAKTPNSARPSAKQSAKSPVVRDDLNECKFCSRRFAADRLGVHEQICGKTARKKRKVYDATKHRVEGTELEQYVKKGTKSVSSKPSKQAPKKDWRRTHEEFISAIRAAKMAQAHVAKGGKLSDLPPPPPSSNPDYIQCPHCGRKFNEAAAERHIPKCANYSFNKPKPGAPPRSKTTARNGR